MSNQSVPWKTANVTENLVLQALQFHYGYLLQILRQGKVIFFASFQDIGK
jgi:hypothetical protein